jgi:hypothetical protein
MLTTCDLSIQINEFSLEFSVKKQRNPLNFDTKPHEQKRHELLAKK